MGSIIVIALKELMCVLCQMPVEVWSVFRSILDADEQGRALQDTLRTRLQDLPLAIAAVNAGLSEVRHVLGRAARSDTTPRRRRYGNRRHSDSDSDF